MKKILLTVLVGIGILILVAALLGMFKFNVLSDLDEFDVDGNRINVEQQINKVAATIFPIYDITRVIAGDEFEVVLLLPPGASPHTFDPQPSVLKNMMDSKALFAIGQGLDDWSHNLAESLGIPVVAVYQGIELRPTREEKNNKHKGEHKDGHGHDHGPVDPHYWLSLTNAGKIAQNIAQELAILDADNANLYFERATEYKKELQILRIAAKDRIKMLDNKNIITSHGAWEYFAYDLGLNIVGSFKSGNAKNPTPRYLAELSKKAEKYNVGTFFIAEQFSSSAIIAFTQDHNLGIAIIDPLGGIGERQSYLELMQYNINQVINSLKE